MSLLPMAAMAVMPHDCATPSPASFSLEDVVQKLTDAGVSAELTKTGDETCGCAAFYPEWRGGKVGWGAE